MSSEGWEEIYGNPIPENPSEEFLHEVSEAVEEMEFIDDELQKLIDECCTGVGCLNWQEGL